MPTDTAPPRGAHRRNRSSGNAAVAGGSADLVIAERGGPSSPLPIHAPPRQAGRRWGAVATLLLAVGLAAVASRWLLSAREPAAVESVRRVQAVTVPLTPDGSCGAAAGYACVAGECCSQYGWCGGGAHAQWGRACAVGDDGGARARWGRACTV